jgi:hypothetical protein
LSEQAKRAARLVRLQELVEQRAAANVARLLRAEAMAAQRRLQLFDFVETGCSTSRLAMSVAGTLERSTSATADIRRQIEVEQGRLEQARRKREAARRLERRILAAQRDLAARSTLEALIEDIGAKVSRKAGD